MFIAFKDLDIILFYVLKPLNFCSFTLKHACFATVSSSCVTLSHVNCFLGPYYVRPTFQFRSYLATYSPQNFEFVIMMLCFMHYLHKHTTLKKIPKLITVHFKQRHRKRCLIFRFFFSCCQVSARFSSCYIYRHGSSLRVQMKGTF